MKIRARECCAWTTSQIFWSVLHGRYWPTFRARKLLRETLREEALKTPAMHVYSSRIPA
jgi:hypothetical protein